jgi:hypothetical protein
MVVSRAEHRKLQSSRTIDAIRIEVKIAGRGVTDAECRWSWRARPTQNSVAGHLN